MFKLVVLTAFFAAAAAKPGALITTLGYTAPIAYTSVLTPAATTISHQASSVVHPSPIAYSTPLSFTHFIKKRSAPINYIAPSPYYASAHLAAAPLAYSSPLAYSAPIVNAAPILPAAHVPYVASHFIKKRSAVLLPTTYSNYVAPATYAAPLHTSYSTPLIHSAPLVHSPLISSPIITPHFIKKRSAPFLATSYIAPTAYSHQSRVDYTHTSPLISTTYTAPIAYSSPISYAHVF